MLGADAFNLNPQELDFALNGVVNKLSALPGDIGRPGNSEWQDRILSAVGRQAVNIHTAACITEPELADSLVKHITDHAARIQETGIGGVITSRRLFELAYVLDSARF